MHIYFLGVFLLFLFGCTPSSPYEFNKESARLQKELLSEFQEVETIEDLAKRGPKIRRLSFEMVSLIKKAAVYYRKTHEEAIPIQLPVSDALKIEMKRIYQFEGGRELVEKHQREALILLDDFAQAMH